MKPHLYTAANMESAMARVRRDLGPDALILSSRRADGRYEVQAVAASHARGWNEPARPQTREPLLSRLLAKNGLDAGLARMLAASSPGEPRTLAEAAGALAHALGQHVTFERPDLSHGRTVMALVGPTGVGKTTTLAKIAARAALVHQRRVGLITLDSYRVGALAQIEAYADLIGIPLEAARDERSFARALRRLADADLVLIDTAGRAPRDKSALIRLAEILHSTESRVNVNLLISATTRPSELDEIVERHAVLLPKWLTVTKVDEARQHDTIVNAHVASGRPLAWLTTGQRVPEDLEDATEAQLAAALCGEEVFR